MLDDLVCPMKDSTIPVVHSTIPFHYTIPLNVDTLSWMETKFGVRTLHAIYASSVDVTSGAAEN